MKQVRILRILPVTRVCKMRSKSKKVRKVCSSLISKWFMKTLLLLEMTIKNHRLIHN